MEAQTGGKSLWQDVLTLIVDTTGKKNGSLTPLATIMTLGPRLVNTMTNRRKKKMEIKCPYCGSEEYEVYDTCGGSGENIQELCACFDCNKQFSVIYVVDCIVKES